MASFTENLGLKKPDRLDRFSIEDFNGNMDIIDTIPDMASGQSLVGVSVGEAYGNIGISGIAEAVEDENIGGNRRTKRISQEAYRGL